jgi:hypothetical protein
MGPVSDRHRRFRDVVIAGGVVAFFVLELAAAGSGWPTAADIVVLLGMALNLATLCWLIWAMATRRIGVTHWAPARQQGRIGARRARQELLEAAERYGSTSPQARAAAEKVKRLSG